MLFGIFAQAAEPPDCVCQRADPYVVAAEAERIVSGRVIEASIVDGQIRFVVDESIHHATSGADSITLTTPAPPSCGARVVVGNRDIYFLRDQSGVVDPCSGSLAPFGADSELLQHAMHVAEYAGGGIGEFKQRFENGPGPYTVEWLEIVFVMANHLRPDSVNYERVDGGYRFHDVLIQVENGELRHVRSYPL